MGTTQIIDMRKRTVHARNTDIGEQLHTRAHESRRKCRLFGDVHVARTRAYDEHLTLGSIGAAQNLLERVALNGMLATVGEEKTRTFKPASVADMLAYDIGRLGAYTRRNDDAMTLEQLLGDGADLLGSLACPVDDLGKTAALRAIVIKIGVIVHAIS